MSPDLAMMHGSDYSGQDITGWTATEKFDGFFARWTGSNLISRQGIDLNAPDWFVAGLPAAPLDCELFAGYGKRGKMSRINRGSGGRWAGLELVIFDAPGAGGNYSNRHAFLWAAVLQRPGLRVAKCWACSDKARLIADLAEVLSRNGEGLMLRHPDSPYIPSRTFTMLKVKAGFIPSEA